VMRRIDLSRACAVVIGAALLLALGAEGAFAQGAAQGAVSAGDTAFVLIAAALVLIMTPGLAFFYGGMVRRKNVLSILIQCFMFLCVVSVQWVLYGYSLSFGPDIHHVIGSLRWAGLHGVGAEPNADYAATIPHSTFMIFQAMFAIITPALIIGSFAERIKFGSLCAFMLLWITFVYDPVAHWVWGAGGWCRNLGALDFAGGTVVHLNAGIAALVMCIMIGRRKDYLVKNLPPHNLPFTVLGTGLLWFGWFGFNAGSALAANGLASNAFVTTNTAAAMAGLTWGIIEWIRNGAPTMLGVASGVVAGLVAITPACGFVSPLSAIAIGISVSVLCYTAVVFIKAKFGYDDALDVFGVHGIGGMWGAIATGLFAEKAINSGGADGLLFGNPRQLLVQLAAVLATLVYSGVLSIVFFKLVDRIMGMRVDEQTETEGLDVTQHRETGYTTVE